MCPDRNWTQRQQKLETPAFPSPPPLSLLCHTREAAAVLPSFTILSFTSFSPLLLFMACSTLESSRYRRLSTTCRDKERMDRSEKKKKKKNSPKVKKNQRVKEERKEEIQTAAELRIQRNWKFETSKAPETITPPSPLSLPPPLCRLPPSSSPWLPPFPPPPSLSLPPLPLIHPGCQSKSLGSVLFLPHLCFSSPSGLTHLLRAGQITWRLARTKL